MLKHLHTFKGHQNPVYALSLSAKPGIFFTAGNDKGVVEWSLNKMAFVMVKMPVQSSVYVLKNHQHLMFIGERSGAFNVYNFLKQEVVARVNAHPKPIFDLQVLPQKNELLSAGEDGTVAVWSLTDFKELYRITVSKQTVRNIAVSPDQTEIAMACKDGKIYIYSAKDFSLKHVLTGHEMAVTAVSYHPQGKYLVSGGRDAQLRVWNLPNYQLQETIPAHLFGIYGIEFHPHLPYFATGSQDKSIKLWDAETFKLKKMHSLEKSGTGHTHSVNKIAWSADGKQLLSTGDDKQVMVWELENV